jgi:catechol 2,3-dioxygenase-like lactoylglutathione lyase family enzyme
MSQILQNHHVLAVHDVRRSAEFYVRVLGFRIVLQPDGWIVVAKDNCMIRLGECPNDMHPSELGFTTTSPISVLMTRIAITTSLKPTVLKPSRR